MSDPAEFLRLVINPGCRILHEVTGTEMGTDEAKVLLLAIALQESGLEHRRQIDSAGNPMATLARGWWQFEKGGGVAGVCTHSSSEAFAKALCTQYYVPFNHDDIHEAIAWNGYLAFCFARLLAFTDPKPVPAIGDIWTAFDFYLRNWRPKGWENPSQDKRDRWAQVYPMAVTAVATAAATGVQPFIAPKPGTLTATTSTGKGIQVDLPEMNRSWRTGDFWLNVLSTLGVILLALSPIVEPLMDHIATSPWLLSIPVGPAIFAAARQYYKGQRVKYAAEVAAAAAKQGPD